MRTTTRRATIKGFAALAVGAAFVAACGSSSTTETPAATTAAEAAATTAATPEPAPADDGKTVTIWSSVDQPVQDGLNKVLTAKAAADGITVKWEKVEDINALIMQKIQANDTPDIALIPQPGVVGNIVKLGKLTPLDDVVDMAALKGTMTPGTLETGTFDGKLYGLLVSMNIKSLVFYNKPAWDKAGYSAPKSIDELNTLTEKIKTDGNTPWCMGIESGGATGWPATDWFEDLVMRYAGVDGYNKWVKQELKFDSPEVRQAAAEFEKLMFTDGNVLGGRSRDRQHGLRRCGHPDVRCGRPRLLDVQAGQLHHRLLPRRHQGRP